MAKIAIIGTGMPQASLERYQYLLSIQTTVFVIEPLWSVSDQTAFLYSNYQSKLKPEKHKEKPDHSYKTVQKKNKFFR